MLLSNATEGRLIYELPAWQCAQLNVQQISLIAGAGLEHRCDLRLGALHSVYALPGVACLFIWLCSTVDAQACWLPCAAIGEWQLVAVCGPWLVQDIYLPGVPDVLQADVLFPHAAVLCLLRSPSHTQADLFLPHAVCLLRVKLFFYCCQASPLWWYGICRTSLGDQSSYCTAHV